MRHGTDGEMGEGLAGARSECDELPAGEINAPHRLAANDRRTVGTGCRLPANPDRAGGRDLDLGQSARAWHVEGRARLTAGGCGYDSLNIALSSAPVAGTNTATWQNSW